MKNKRSQKESVAGAKKAIETGKSVADGVVRGFKVAAAMALIGAGIVTIIAKGFLLSVIKKDENK